ncbi:MAG: M20 family metallopeptidase [Polyangiaceae bacterium]
MPIENEIVRVLDATVDAEAASLEDLALKIHASPELRFEEHKAAAWIGELVENRGFKVERGLAGMPTSFRARAGKSGGPKIAILAEYDALPDIGHACGHNLIAASAVGAFFAIARVAEKLGGEAILLGTPAEEGGGGKIKLIDAGAFEDVAAAMMFHPFDRDLLAHPALANSYVRLDFHGRPSHAAAAPHEGKSALTACMDAFRLIDGQRVHFKDGVRVHGYITRGGKAVNIIVEDASAEFSVRARDAAELERVTKIVERCARGAALASDVSVNVQARAGYRDMKNNMAIAKKFGEHFAALGRKPRDGDPRVGAGSTDMGDVSHVVPSIHPYAAVVDEGGPLIHTREFAEATKSARGIETALVVSKAMARTAAEIMSDPKLREQMNDEWRSA